MTDIDHAAARESSERLLNAPDDETVTIDVDNLARAYLALTRQPSEGGAWERFGRGVLAEFMTTTEGVQDLAEECGVVVPVRVTEPCVARDGVCLLRV
jgi:hypothetical protein